MELAVVNGNVRTIFENAQNVHTESVEESVFEILEFLNSLPIYMIQKDPVDFNYVNSHIEKMLKQELEKIRKDRHPGESCDSPAGENFCSPECSLAYLYGDNTISDGTRWNKHVLLNALYSYLYSEPISPAPPRSLLRMFGGPLDIKQYRSYLLTNDLVHENFAPIRLVFPVMAIQGPLRDIKKIVSLSNDVIEKASESLRLKRSKPVNLNVPTLDLCIKSS
jgi:hypothetical protein